MASISRTAIASLAFMLTAAPAFAASDYLLKLDGIPGESAAKGGDGHKEWIEISSLSFKAAVATPRDASTGLATGKRQHKPLTIRKELDRASPAAGAKIAAPDGGEQAALLLPAVQKVREAAARMPAWPGCTPGQPVPGVTIREAATGRTARVLDAVVSACAAESVSLNFTKIEWK